MSRRKLLQVGAAAVLRPGVFSAPTNNRHSMDTNEPGMKAEQILKYLDEQFDLDRLGNSPPVLDNANFLLADARLSVFRSHKHWAIFFETVTCDRGSDTSLNFYVYGNCLQGANDFSNAGLLEQESRSLFAWPEDQPFRSAKGNTLSRNRFSILLNGKRYNFVPTPQDYAMARIAFDGFRPEPDELRPIELVRFLCHHLNHPFFATQSHLRYLLDAYRPEQKQEQAPFSSHTLPLLIQTRQWRHPDAGEPPSKVFGFQVLARAIETGDVKEWRRLDPATFNTDWAIYEAREQALARPNAPR